VRGAGPRASVMIMVSVSSGLMTFMPKIRLRALLVSAHNGETPRRLRP